MIAALVNLEPKIHNTALMQISYYHKQQGDAVEWFSPLFAGRYDKIYCSSIFDFTNKSQVPKNAIVGGTGFNVESKLPKEIEDSNLDYSIYPSCKRSYLWFSRGCNGKCWFCIVQRKEGLLASVEPKNLNPNGKDIAVMDNNFFEAPKWRESLQYLIEARQPLEFYGVKAATFTKEHADALSEVKRRYILHCAWDNPKENTIEHLQRMAQYISKRKIRVYYLSVGDQEADSYRSEKMFYAGFDAFCMPIKRSDPYQRARARWENMKAIRKTVPFEEYRSGSWNTQSRLSAGCRLLGCNKQEGKV